MSDRDYNMVRHPTGDTAMNYENEKTEFKSVLTDDLYKEVVAFINTDGGTIYIGVDDNGNAVGLDDVDREYNRITNGIRDAIMPDAAMFVRYALQEDKVVRIEISEGTNKPYYLKSKGLKPSGVYVRQGSSSVPASIEQIRRMIKENDGDVFEEMRSVEQDLTFESAAAAFKMYGVEFGPEKYRALGITQKNSGLFTNLALIVSDQCSHTTKVAVFGDNSNTVFKDNKEFGGSVFRQLEDTFNYLMLCNRTGSTFRGLERIERKDYPEEALREALLNALVHRDYSFSGSVIINVNDERIEFISLGGLLPGLSTEDIMIGISQPRNKALAEMFHRLRLIESYGTGIRRIYRLYERCPVQPQIVVSPNAFKIILPNMTACAASEPEKRGKLTPQMREILDIASRQGGITDEEIRALLDIKKTRAYTLVKEMREMGLLRAVGRGAEKRYVRA